MNRLYTLSIFNLIRGKSLSVLIFQAVFFTIIFQFDFAHAKAELTAAEPTICYKCHKELKDNLSAKYVHFLFKQGKCSTCHNPHVSKDKGLLREDINPLCLGCHENIKNIIATGRQHSAIRDGACTDCHFAHSSNNNNLMVKPEKDLCWKCHEELKPQLEKKYACSPFKNGDCSACHNAHGSSEDNLLHSNPKATCKKCHNSVGCKSGSISISALTKDMNCISCHSGHSSDSKGMLGPYGHKVFINKECVKCHKPIKEGEKITTLAVGDVLCLNCHREKTEVIEDDVHGRGDAYSCTLCHDHHASEKSNLTKSESRLCVKCHADTEKRTVFMEKALKSKRECEPIKNRECFECHVPKHSRRILNFKQDVFVLCNECHETEHKITHPLGADVIDVRNGQPITCVTCHSMHSAKASYMLTHDGKRTLCIQCHKY